MKMYILVLEDVPVGHAINSAAHAALACYLKYGETPEMQAWLANSFKKVACKVTLEQLEKAKEMADDFVSITESNLDGRLMCVAFKPRETFDPYFKTLSLWR